MSDPKFCPAGKVRCECVRSNYTGGWICDAASANISNCTVCVRPEYQRPPVRTDAELLEDARQLILHVADGVTPARITLRSWLSDYDAAHPTGDMLKVSDTHYKFISHSPAGGEPIRGSSGNVNAGGNTSNLPPDAPNPGEGYELCRQADPKWIHGWCPHCNQWISSGTIHATHLLHLTHYRKEKATP
jgi:hypothetical protein